MLTPILPFEISLATRREAFIQQNAMTDLIRPGKDLWALALALAATMQVICDELDEDPSDMMDEALSAIEDNRATVTMAEVGDLVPPGFVSSFLLD